MQKVKNSDGHLVAEIDEETGTVIIARRGCETYITLDGDGDVIVVNVKADEVTGK